VDPLKLRAELLRYASTPRTREELIGLIARHAKLPMGVATHVVWGFVGAFGTLVHVPSSGSWSARRGGEVVAARAVLRRMTEPAFDEAVEHTVRRHLAAFVAADDSTGGTNQLG
jgi:hypothetical protein